MPLKKQAAATAIQTTVSPRSVTVHTPANQLVPGLGNVTSQDIIVPRLKIMQGTSPELQDNPDLRLGNLYHSLLGESLGNEIEVCVLQIQRSIELWAPRDDERGVLARSTDGIHWDKPNQEFEVIIKRKRHVWKTMGSVGESGLAEFGSSNPDDPNSAPIASLTYRIALLMPGKTELGPMLLIAAKTGVKPSKDLISRINLRHLAGTPFYAQKYMLASIYRTSGEERKWYEPIFRNAGNVKDPELIGMLQGLSEGFATMNVRAADERDDGEPVREDKSHERRY